MHTFEQCKSTGFPPFMIDDIIWNSGWRWQNNRKNDNWFVNSKKTKIMRIIFTSLLMVCMTGIALAREIVSLTIKDGTTLLFYESKNFQSPQFVVAPDVDMSNVNFDLTLAEEYEIEDGKEIPSDFSSNNMQGLELRNILNAQARTCYIYVRQLIPASLPFSLVFSDENKSEWTPTTVGWAGVAVDVYPYMKTSNIAQFVIGFNEDPSDLTYELYALGGEDFKGYLDIYESADGATWEKLISYSPESNPVPSEKGAPPETVALKSTTRYVKLYDPTGDRNKVTCVNNIKVTKAGSAIDPVQTTKDIAYQPARGEVVFKQPVAKVELYNALGALTAVYTDPGSALSIKDKVAGVSVLRITLTDGTVVYLKAI